MQILSFASLTCAFLPHTISTSFIRAPSSCLQGNDNNSNDTIENTSPLAKASWYAVEAFGKIFAPESTNDEKDTKSGLKIDTTKTPSSLRETLERIKLDNDRYYFLSGQVDSLSYDDNCIFADPFVSFSGTQRFVDNLQNLGSFITNYDVKLLKYDVTGDQLTVQTKLMVKLELNLPWKPILAWPWGVEYKIDETTYKITSHIESWDIEPLEGVKQIFRKPTLKIKS